MPLSEALDGMLQRVLDEVDNKEPEEFENSRDTVRRWPTWQCMSQHMSQTLQDTLHPSRTAVKGTFEWAAKIAQIWVHTCAGLAKKDLFHRVEMVAIF